MADEIIPDAGSVKPIRTGNVPVADVDFGTLVQNVSTKWTANVWLTLQWLTPVKFAANAAAYNATLTARQQTGSTRSQTTNALKILDKNIEEAVVYVKGYILETYKKESSKSYYPAFGIAHIGGRYTLPKDQNSRSAALKLMIDAIATNGFGTKEFGTTFWTTTKTQYDVLRAAATTTDSQVSSKVGNKNILKADLKKSLNAIVSVIKANYPDNYKQELRNWGFQKEKY